MNELTLILSDCAWLEKGLDGYLLSQKGIHEVNINYSNNEIYVKYDSNTVIEIIKKEILLFISSLDTPSIFAFDKHSKNKLIKKDIIINDLCCEYCLNGIIEDLLSTNGIESAFSDFDYSNKTDVKITVEYDKNIISEREILDIEKKHNYNGE